MWRSHKDTFVYSAVSSPSDCLKRFTLHTTLKDNLKEVHQQTLEGGSTFAPTHLIKTTDKKAQTRVRQNSQQLGLK